MSHRPQRPEYYPGEFDTDDFGPEPDPALYRTVDETAERAAARAEVAGRRAAARANAEQGIATSADIAILTDTPDQETAMDTTPETETEARNADGSSVALFGADCVICGAARCMGRLICGCDLEEGEW